MLLSIFKKKAIVSLNEISTFRLKNCSSEKLLKSGFDQLRFAMPSSLQHAIISFSSITISLRIWSNLLGPDNKDCPLPILRF